MYIPSDVFLLLFACLSFSLGIVAAISFPLSLFSFFFFFCVLLRPFGRQNLAHSLLLPQVPASRSSAGRLFSIFFICRST